MNKSEIFDRLKEGMQAAGFSDEEKELHLQHYTEKFAGYTDEMLFEEIGKRGGIDAFVQSVIGNRNNVLLKDVVYRKAVGIPQEDLSTGVSKDHAGQSNDETLHQVDHQDLSSSSAVDNNSTSFSKSRDENDLESQTSSAFATSEQEMRAVDKHSNDAESILSAKNTNGSQNEQVPGTNTENADNDTTDIAQTSRDDVEVETSEDQIPVQADEKQLEYGDLAFLFGDEPEEDEEESGLVDGSDGGRGLSVGENETDESFFPTDERYFSQQAALNTASKSSNGDETQGLKNTEEQLPFESTHIDGAQNMQQGLQTNDIFADDATRIMPSRLEEQQTVGGRLATHLTDLQDEDMRADNTAATFDQAATRSIDTQDTDDEMQTADEIPSPRTSHLREITYHGEPSPEARRKFIIGATLLSPFGALIFLVCMSVVGVIWLVSVLLIPLLLALMLAICVVGIVLSVVGFVYGLSQLFTVKPVGMFEIGLGIIILGATILISTLIYNLAVRVIPKLIRRCWRLVCRTFWLLADLFCYIRGECYRT
ncbi:MAG: hypothetical protein KHW87_07935 [Clostridiales bacterium]|nr:hypothetical protein [Clostridiales bacterium]